VELSRTAVSITAALIVKNEERTLPCCLESIGDAVDQIVVVDTGSEDATREVARRYGAEVHEFAWRQDFSAARQFSFDCARGTWVFWVDADDEVLNAAAIRESTAAADPSVDGFYWKYMVAHDDHGHTSWELWRERCVRNDGRFRWHGRVHEVLLADAETRLVRDETVAVVHRPPAIRPHKDPKRNLAILEAEYASTTRPSPRLLLYLGNEYADHGDQERALGFLRRYVDVATWSDEKYLAQLRVAALQRQMGRYDEAIDTALAALKTHHDWPQAYFSLGETYYFLQDWPKVAHWIECGRRLAEPQTLCVINPLEYRYTWIIHYVHALFHVGRVNEARDWSRHALTICPDDAWHLTNVERLQASALAGVG
jgi:glycosyltransferase involved in cell wall biosynthesis